MRIALLGAGNIAKVHAGSIAAHPGMRLAGVADIRREAAEELAGRYGSQVIDAEQAFADETIDALVIASSTATHAGFLERAAAAGKAVLCEKPVALELELTRRAIERVKKAKILCAIGFNRRHDPQFSALKQALEQGRIGRLETLAITSRDPAPPPLAYLRRSGGLFRDMTIHDFDLARWLLDEPIAEVHAVGSALIDPAIAEARDIDTAMVTLVTASGRLCHISNSRRACYGYDQRIEAFGSLGMLQANNETETRLRTLIADGQFEPPPKWFYLERYAEAYRREMNDFFDAWRQSRAPLASAEDGYQAQRLAEAAARSQASGQAVSLAGLD